MSSKDFQFSILIPSWNNIDFLKLCIKSIQKHSSFQHQIIVHVNEGNDGTINFLQNNNIDYTFSKDNIGICKALNLAAKKAKTDYIVYMNDDMYVLPLWDALLMQEINLLPDNMFYLSSTLLEPIPKGNPSVISPANFGTDIASFKEQELLDNFNRFEFEDWSGSSWPPSIVHKDLWNKVGGYSEEFSPGYYSDPDFSMKLWKEGVRYFKGISASRVYHFQSKSLGRIEKNDGRRQFYEKWGITASFLDKKMIRKGKAFVNHFPEPNKFSLFLNKLKVFFYKGKNKFLG